MISKHSLNQSFAALSALATTACTPQIASFTDASPDNEAQKRSTISKIYWSDGDSGRIDGHKFRLANIDAPETGGIGSIGGAKCEAERELGFAAKAFMVEATRNADIQITKSFGKDRYEREVVTLSVKGVDLNQLALEAGHIRPWPHKGRKSLARKPDWCTG